MSLPSQLLLNSLRLEDIFCYQQMEVSFESGVSVFAGNNGSGKSSLMESIFFGLFGSSTKKVTGKELSEVLREGQRSGTLTLDFSFSNSNYIAQLMLKRTGERVSAEGSKYLLFKDGIEVANGVKGVTDFIQSMLEMDAEDFANCLYVRQGEVDRLINASPQDCQRMIDRLLRLTKIDAYEQRLKEALTALNRRKTLFQGSIGTLSQDIEQLKAQNLAAQRLKYEQELAKISVAQQTLQQQVADEENRIRQLQDTLTRYDQTTNAMKQLQTQYEQTTEQLQTTEAELKHVLQQHQHVQQELQDLKAQSLHKENFWQQQGLTPPFSTAFVEQLRQDQTEKANAAQTLKDACIEIRSDQRITTQAVTEISAQRDDLAPKLTHYDATLSQLETQITNSVRALRQVPSEALCKLPLAHWAQESEQKLGQQREIRQQSREKAAALAATLKSLKKEDQRIKELVSKGHCPTCHQTVTVESFADHSHPLKEQIESNRQQLATISKQFEMLDHEIGALESEARAWTDVLDKFKQWDELKRLRETRLPQLEQLTQKITELEAHLKQLKTKETVLITEGQQVQQGVDKGEKILALVEQSVRLEETVSQRSQGRENLRQRRETLSQLRDNQRRELQQLSERFDALKTQLEGQSPEGLKKEFLQHQHQQQKLTQQLEKQQQQRDSVQHQLGHLNTQQQQLEQQEQRLAAQRQQWDSLIILEAETERLQNVYQRVKTSQRQKNFDAINASFNHFFTLMQPGPAYHGVRFNEAFDIEVVRTNEQTISPALLSGGERALLNLALRAALHQVICEAGGVLLPLFFDEPTVFLDTHHVQQLERLFEELGQRVGQVIVVSHEIALVEGIAHEYQVRKDADNLSQVEKVR